MKLLKSKEVAERIGISYDYFMREVKYQVTFPKPVKLTPKANAKWRDTDIDQFIATS